MDDPNLFAPFFRGSSWDGWRAFLAALFAAQMSDDALALYQHHTGRQDAPASPFKEAALIIGRRGGKSRVLATIAAYLACFRDYRPHLAPGEVATVAVIASDRRQARSIFNYCKGLFDEIPLLKNMVAEETQETITLNNRVAIEITTASFRATRGYTYAAVLADETAFWRDETSANPDVEIFKALRPGLSTIPGSILLNASSPYRKRGVLYTTYARHFGQNNSRVLVWKASTLEMNPALDAEEVEKAYEDDPESAAAEYGAEFRNDLSDFIPRDAIDACTVRGCREITPVGGKRYVAFIDPAGGTGSDSMTLAIGHQDGDRAVLDAVREAKPPYSPEQVTIEFASLLKTYGVVRVQGDRYAGEWPRERLRAHGIAYDLSSQPKSDIYRDCLPVLNSGRAQLLDIPRLASQFCGLERRTSRAGRDQIDHAPGAHDDLANAVAGVLLMADARKAHGARAVKINIMAR